MKTCTDTHTHTEHHPALRKQKPSVTARKGREGLQQARHAGERNAAERHVAWSPTTGTQNRLLPARGGAGDVPTWSRRVNAQT